MNNKYKGITLPKEFPEDLNDKEFYKNTLKLEKDVYELLISDDESEINEGIYQSPLASAKFFYILYKSYYFYDELKSSYWKENLEKAVYYYYQKRYHDLYHIYEIGNIDMFKSNYLSFFNNFNRDKGFFKFLIQNNLLLVLEPPILIYEYHKEFGDTESTKFWYGMLKTIYISLEKEAKSLKEGIEQEDGNDPYDELCKNVFTNFIEEVNQNIELYKMGKEILKMDANK